MQVRKLFAVVEDIDVYLAENFHGELSYVVAMRQVWSALEQRWGKSR